MKRPLVLGMAGVGALLAALPPLSWWPLAFLAPWPLALLACEARSGARAFWRLTLAGVVLFAQGSSWLAETTWVNLVLVTAVEAPLLGLFGWLAHRVLPGRPAWPALPVTWVAVEMVRLHLPLSGYPWQFLGHALAASRTWVQSADLGGVLLVSFVAASGAAAAMALARGAERRWPALGVVLLAGAYGLVRPATLSEPEPGPVLATIQPGFAQILKDGGLPADERFRTCVDLSRQALADARQPILLVWPETTWPYPMGEGGAEDVWFQDGTTPFGPAQAGPLTARLLERLRRWATPAGRPAPALLIGASYRLPDGEGGTAVANSAVLFDRIGRQTGRYDKHILVPGGEYVPFADFLPQSWRRAVADWIESLAGFVAQLKPGPGPGLLFLDGLPFGVTICYENAYGDYARRFVGNGARFLVNLSNEAWFGTSTEFDHMALQDRLRAVETRRAVFRSTYSGVSGLVPPDGGPAQRLLVGGRDRGVQGVFVARVPLHADRAPYVWWGDALGWICLVWAAALAAFRRQEWVS